MNLINIDMDALAKAIDSNTDANEQEARAIINTVLSAQPQPEPQEAAEPPLIGRWHHGEGVLVSGSIRISTWDCDTNPPDEFRDNVLDWMCNTLNAAVKHWEKNAPDPFALSAPQEAGKP